MSKFFSPKVSIVLPVYNVEKYLHKSLQSILSQSFQDIEVIAVNDGSTDSSGEILSEYAQKDSRLHVIKQANAGLGAARNRGMKEATGTYLFFVDSDDYISKSAVQRLYQIAVEGDFDLVCFNLVVVDEDYNQIERRRVKQVTEIQGGIVPLTLFMQGKLFRPNAYDKLIRRDLIRSHQLMFPEGVYFEDCLLSLQLLFYATRIKTVDEDCYFYMQRRGSITRSFSRKHLLDTQQLCDDIETWLQNIEMWEVLKKDFGRLAASAWSYALKIVFAMASNKDPYRLYRDMVPPNLWRKINLRYRFFWWLGKYFPSLPSKFVAEP